MELTQEVERPIPFFAQAGSIAWQTPPDVIEAAREVLRGIALDPCAGVKTRHAEYNVHLPEDGLAWDWARFVPAHYPRTFFENVPFGTSWVCGDACLSAKEFLDAVRNGSITNKGEWRRQTLKDWADKTALEVERGWEGIWISKAALETKALQKLMKVASGVCHPRKRINYVDPATRKVQTGVNFSSVILYFGPHSLTFKNVFEVRFGYVFTQ